MYKKLQIPLVLSWCIAALYAISFIGFRYFLARDELRAPEQIANDIVRNGISTSIILIAFIVPIILSMRGSLRAVLIWLGFICFFLYSHFFFFNTLGGQDIFVDICRGLISLFSLLVLLFTFRALDFRKIASRFSEKTPLKIAILYFALGFAMIYLYPVLLYREQFGDREMSEFLWYMFHPQNMVGLLLIGPLYIYLIVAIIRKRPLGYILTPIVMVFNVIPVAFIVSGLFFSKAYLMLLLEFLLNCFLIALIVLFLRSFDDRPDQDRAVSRI
jgi:hypothetical protein